jgi:hypothetical protein
VEGPAAVVVVDVPAEDVADEEVAEVVAELVVSFDLFAWQPEPISANAATAEVNATVRLLISRISFLSNLDRTAVGVSNSDAIPIQDQRARTGIGPCGGRR